MFGYYSQFGVLQRSVVQQLRLPILAPGQNADVMLINAVALIELQLT